MSLPRLSAASGAATAAASVNYKSCWNYSLPKFCESSTLVACFKIDRGFPNLGSSCRQDFTASDAATAAASVTYKSCWNYSLPKFCESSTLVAGFKIERGFPDLGSSWFWDACTTLVLVLLSFSAACETETMNVYSRGKVRLLKRPLTSQSEVYWKQCSSQWSSQCFLLPVPRIKMLAYGTANSLHHWYR